MSQTILQFLFALIIFPCLAGTVYAQAGDPSQWRSMEISEDDGLPVLIKHLPDWESVRSSTVFVNSADDLKSAVPYRPILDVIEFAGGTEAVAADYSVGKMVIIEFPTPQGSASADARVLERLAQNPDPATVYRRIGNYNAFVFDVADPEAAIALLDQVRYQKSVQWLGEDPFLLRKIERYFVETTRDIFIATVTWIVGGFGLSAVIGLIVGLGYFRYREQQRAKWNAYSDAGGMTRLNLDKLSD
ncbi:MAG TPA: hypothetical protein PKD26_16490 [Pyrinomonadaceae bacterium]|nr:hypothetical protein [Pyrinomonadaceae bacterium]